MSNALSVTTYAEHTDDPKSWSSPRPSFDLDRFNRELEKRAGCIGSVPRFRCVWAGEKYLLDMYSVHVGYQYSEKGEVKFVSATDLEFEFPEGAIINPAFKDVEVFIPRWMVEEYHPDAGGYQRLYAIEEVEAMHDEGGRVDLLSTYREPGEVDIHICRGYAQKLATLTASDLEARKVRDAQARAKVKAENRAELISSIQEETVKALTDGLPNATKFGYDPNLRFDIRKHTENLIKEHDAKL